jgi:DNA replication protein DnaC
MDMVVTVKDNLKALGLTESSRQLEQVLDSARQNDWTPLKTLGLLLEKEQLHRQDMGKARRLKAALLPFHKTLTDFDYGFQPGISQKQMQQLAEMTWLEGAYNILFLGPPGVGKTHLSVALGMAAIEAGYRVYFTTMDQLISNLKTEAISTRSQRQLRTLHGTRSHP